MIHVNDLTQRIGGRVLLDRATVAIPEGARVGIVGRNGTGKTTFFRVLAGDLSPDGGSVFLPRGARLGRVAQEAPGGPQSLVETVLAADTERASLLAEAETATDPGRIADIQTRLADIDAYGAPSRAARILAGLGFSAEQQLRPCSDFSGGWRMRVALAAVLFSEPDLLLLDEPTNHLDLEGTLWLQDYLAKYPRSVLTISHDRDLLNSAVDHILHLDAGKLTLWRGNYDSFERQRREKLVLDLKLKRKQDDERRRLQAFVDRFRAKASKAVQAQSRLKRLAKMEPSTAAIEQAVQPFFIPAPQKQLAPPIVAMDEVAVGYDETPILRRLSLRISNDDRIALLGQNGNGKSTLAKLISGRLKPLSGSLRRWDKLGVGFFAQHQLEDLSPEDSPYRHVREKMPEATEAQVRARTAQIGFSADKADIPAKNLSGGEKARLAFGLAVFEGPHLLILDEPTNHLDIDSREALVQALADYPGAVILISHDRHLLDATADRLWLVADGTVKPFEGDLDEYQRLILARDKTPAQTANGTAAPDRGEARRAAAARRSELAPLRRQIEGHEKRMASLEKEIARLDKELGNGAFNDPKKGAELAKRRAEAVRALAEAEEAWLAASAEYEESVAATG